MPVQNVGQSGNEDVVNRLNLTSYKWRPYAELCQYILAQVWAYQVCWPMNGSVNILVHRKTRKRDKQFPILVQFCSFAIIKAVTVRASPVHHILLQINPRGTRLVEWKTVVTRKFSMLNCHSKEICDVITLGMHGLNYCHRLNNKNSHGRIQS